jgi:hypothetical protein
MIPKPGSVIRITPISHFGSASVIRRRRLCVRISSLAEIGERIYKYYARNIGFLGRRTFKSKRGASTASTFNVHDVTGLLRVFVRALDRARRETIVRALRTWRMRSSAKSNAPQFKN